MAQRIDDLLNNQNLLADVAVLALGQAGLLTVRCNCLVDHHSVTGGRNGFRISMACIMLTDIGLVAFVFAVRVLGIRFRIRVTQCIYIVIHIAFTAIAGVYGIALVLAGGQCHNSLIIVFAGGRNFLECRIHTLSAVFISFPARLAAGCSLCGNLHDLMVVRLALRFPASFAGLGVFAVSILPCMLMGNKFAHRIQFRGKHQRIRSLFHGPVSGVCSDSIQALHQAAQFITCHIHICFRPQFDQISGSKDILKAIQVTQYIRIILRKLFKGFRQEHSAQILLNQIHGGGQLFIIPVIIGQRFGHTLFDSVLFVAFQIFLNVSQMNIHRQLAVTVHMIQQIVIIGLRIRPKDHFLDISQGQIILRHLGQGVHLLLRSLHSELVQIVSVIFNQSLRQIQIILNILHIDRAAIQDLQFISDLHTGHFLAGIYGFTCKHHSIRSSIGKADLCGYRSPPQIIQTAFVIQCGDLAAGNGHQLLCLHLNVIGVTNQVVFRPDRVRHQNVLSCRSVITNQGGCHDLSQTAVQLFIANRCGNVGFQNLIQLQRIVLLTVHTQDPGVHRVIVGFRIQIGQLIFRIVSKNMPVGFRGILCSRIQLVFYTFK